MAARKFLPDDLVLAKMKKFPPWPAKIVHFPRNRKASTQKKSHFVYFFGSNNYAEILNENITPYSEVALERFIERKSRAYQEALKDFFDYAHSKRKRKRNPLKIEKQTIRNANKKHSNWTIKDGSRCPDKDSQKKENDGRSRKGEKANDRRSRKGKKRNDESDLQKQNRRKGRGFRPQKRGSKNDGKDPLQKREKKDGSGLSSLTQENENGARDSLRMIERKKGGRNSSTPKRERKKKKIQKGTKDTAPKQIRRNKSEEVKYKNQSSAFQKERERGGNVSSDDSWNDTYHSFIDKYLSPCTKKDRKSIEASKKKFGFIGLGNIGNAIVINLINSGHDVTVWNRSIHKCQKYIALGAKIASSPADLVIASDIIFCCVSGPDASIEVVFGDQGVLKGLEQVDECGLGLRGYVELTSIDPETSVRIKKAISRKRGLYLEVPIYGSRQKIERGESIVTATGDRRLYAQCETCFHSFARNAYYLNSDIGFAVATFLCQDGMFNSVLVLLAEGLALAERLGLEKTILIDILRLCLQNKMMTFESMRRMGGRAFPPSKFLLKAMDLALDMADKVGQKMPVTAAVSKKFRLPYSDVSRE